MYIRQYNKPQIGAFSKNQYYKPRNEKFISSFLLFISNKLDVYNRDKKVVQKTTRREQIIKMILY